MNPLIINEPGLLTLRHRFANSFLTLVFWGFWIYLCLPVISLVAWWAGFHLFYQEMIVQKGYQAFFDIAGWYGMVVLSIAIIFLSWALYNLLRFRGKERRKRAGSVRKADIARQFGVQADQIDRWQEAKRLTVYHNEKAGSTGSRCEPGDPNRSLRIPGISLFYALICLTISISFCYF